MISARQKAGKIIDWEWRVVSADWSVIVMKAGEVAMTVGEVEWASETASVYVLE